MSGPRTSIVIPARDAALTIGRTLDSLSTQTWVDYEVIVVDDHSSDDTPALVAERGQSDDRITLISNHRRGVSAARNRGLESARGALVLFLDADDEVTPNWLEEMVQPFSDSPGVALTCCGVVNATDVEESIAFPRSLGGLYGDGRFLFLAGTFCVLRSLAVQTGGYDETIGTGENFEFGVRIVSALGDAGLEHRVIDLPLLLRHIAHDRRMQRDAGRLETAERLLDKFAVELDADDKERSQLHRVAAVNAARIGDQIRARHHARSAVRARPLTAKAWATAAIAHVPPLQQRWLRSARATHAPHAFIVGSPRSGTTLLASLLESNGSFAVPNESGFVLQSFERGNGPTETRQLLERWRSDPRLGAWGLTDETWDAIAAERQHCRPTDLLAAAYRRFGTHAGDKLVIDKTPQFVNFSSLLAEVFPTAHIIHLTRDGRDVAASWLDGDWGVSSIRDAAYRWDLQNQRGLEIAHGHPNYIRVRYEHLVEHPEGTLGPVLERLGVDPDSISLEHRGPERIDKMPRPEYHTRLTLPPTPGLRDWRRELSASQIATFERIAGRTLHDLGYSTRSTVHPAVGTTSRAAVKLARAMDQLQHRVSG